MASGLRRYILGLVFVITFSFLIILFVGRFLSITNPSSDVLTNNSGLNSSLNALNSSMDDFISKSNEAASILSDSQPSATEFLFLIFKGAFDIPITIFKFVGSGITALTSIFLGLGGKGGVGAIIFPIILAGITLTIVLLIVKAIRTGETEY